MRLEPVSAFGTTLFSGTPFIRWALTPFILSFAIAFPSVSEIDSLERGFIVAGLELLCVLLLIALWAPRRAAVIAGRILCGMVFAFYLMFLGSEIFLPKKTRLNSELFQPILGFIVIGLPAFCYAALGRFTIRIKQPVDLEKPGRVNFAEKAITYVSAGRVEKCVRWEDLREVSIVTTNEGPWLEDVFWVFVGSDGSAACVVPQGAEGADEVFGHVEKLAGYDDQQVIKAMGSTDNAKFIVWKRT